MLVPRIFPPVSDFAALAACPRSVDVPSYLLTSIYLREGYRGSSRSHRATCSAKLKAQTSRVQGMPLSQASLWVWLITIRLGGARDTIFMLCAVTIAYRILRTSGPLHRPKWTKPPSGAHYNDPAGGRAGGGCGEHHFRAGRPTAYAFPVF